MNGQLRFCAGCGLSHYGEIDAKCPVELRYRGGYRETGAQAYLRRGPLVQSEVPTGAQKTLDEAFKNLKARPS